MGFLYVLRDFLCNKPLLNQEKDVSNNAVLKFLTKAVPPHCTCDEPCSNAKYGRNVHLVLKDNPRLFNTPPRGSEEWKLEYNARTSAELFNKREKLDYKLEDGRYRPSMMWYFRLFAIMMCQHLDAWTLPKSSRLKELFDQAA